MAGDAEGEARRRRRYGRTVTYGLVALVALAPLTTVEAWPFTTLQLFSHVRSPVSTRYDAIGVAADGRAVRLRAGWALQRTKSLTPAEVGPDLCRRWVRLAHAQIGSETLLVRSERTTYRLRRTTDGVEWRPTRATVRWTCRR